MTQAEVNIGMLGHVDHGKTSITQSLTGTWTDTHSEEIKRGITIRLGYADTVIKKCPKCPEPRCFTVADKCPDCGAPAEPVRRISILDAPGHETLMMTAISASNIVDGAILVIAANEKCPQPQTLEHLAILEIMGVKNIIIVQNKVDLVSKEDAVKNHDEIVKFLETTNMKSLPIIPTVANNGINMDVLLAQIQTSIPTPKRDLDAPPRLYIARSFDVNKPGTKISKLVGGVIGGSIIHGKLSVGDELELRPGIRSVDKGKESFDPIVFKVKSLGTGKEKLKEALPGGLIAIGTSLDPSLTKSDGLVGNMVGKPGTLPEVSTQIEIEFHKMERIGLDIPPIKIEEPLVISIGTTTSIAFIEKMKRDKFSLKLKRPICADSGSKLAVCRRISQRWRLFGYGILN
ncbi:MAG: translation initiation factor IF-2 subunit gamma [Candidatus Micrarchaeota archaeon]